MLTQRNTLFLDYVGTMLGVYGAYAWPMLIHVRPLQALLDPYSGYAGLMLSQKQRVPSFSCYPAQKEHVVFGSCRDHVGRIWSLFWAYDDPCYRLLEAMLGPYSGHVELMLSQEWRVPFKPLPGPKGTRRFWCRDHVGCIWSLCWAYVDPC